MTERLGVKTKINLEKIKGFYDEGLSREINSSRRKAEAF
jgi:hypothetical protein